MMTQGDLAQFVSHAPAGRVTVAAGISIAHLQNRLEATPADTDRITLFLEASAHPQCLNIDDVLNGLAKTAREMWPFWFGSCDFSQFTDDTAGRLGSEALIRASIQSFPTISMAWAKSAVGAALAGKLPRVRGIAAEFEIQQLCEAICPHGLVLVFNLEPIPAEDHCVGLINLLEWTARHGSCAVVVVIGQVPPNSPPFDRILFGAETFTICQCPDSTPSEISEPGLTPTWLGPIRGRPHPLSTNEKLLAEALGRDPELGALFSFNQVVQTVQGSQPKVDILWRIGSLIVEIDGYPDHSTRLAFVGDRQRDYELLLSGYTVLRIANEEVEQNLERAVDKIRAVVRHQRLRQMGST